MEQISTHGVAGGELPLHLPRKKNDKSCIDLLLEYGAEDLPPTEELSESDTVSTGAGSAAAEAEAELD